VLGLVLAAFLAAPAVADVTLPSVIASHMVLQRDIPIPIWGWAEPGEEVTVSIGGDKAAVKADENGNWMVRLPQMKAGGPHKLTIAGKNEIALTDVMVGEVWIGSGQSNMQWNLTATQNGGQEIATAKYPNIRLYLVPNVLSGVPMKNVNATWKQCSPATAPPFSAVLYLFGRHLHKELDVPVGLIASSWGGSRIEPWTPIPGFESVDRLRAIALSIHGANRSYLRALKKSPNVPKDWLARAQKASVRGLPLPGAGALPPHPYAGWASPTSMYNAMINPIVPFGCRGAIWYQGESNMGEGMLYYYKTKALVQGWRKMWGQKKLSFYWAQIAPFNYGGDPHRLPRLWEAQTAAMAIPDTGMAVLTDIGNPGDIHPRNKQDVGKRLALWALAKDYGKDVVHFGPLYKSMKIEGNKIRVSFDHVGSGLELRHGTEPDWFEIAGDGGFVKARAVIDGDAVLVSSDEVAKPMAVRFAWHQLAMPNLRNKEGLPACPFRTTCTAPRISGRLMFLKTATVELLSDDELGVIRYTRDGTVPTVRSKAYKAPFEISATTTVKARFFRNDGRASAVVTSAFKKVQPEKHNGKVLGPGVEYEYYEGEWATLPDFDKLTPAKSGVAAAVSIAARRRNDRFGFRFTGYLKVEKAGDYLFECASDDGSRLMIDGKTAIDNNGIHPVVSKRAMASLKPGWHEVVVLFFEGLGGEALIFRYQPPGGQMQEVPLWCEG